MFSMRPLSKMYLGYLLKIGICKYVYLWSKMFHLWNKQKATCNSEPHITSAIELIELRSDPFSERVDLQGSDIRTSIRHTSMKGAVIVLWVLPTEDCTLIKDYVSSYDSVCLQGRFLSEIFYNLLW